MSYKLFNRKFLIKSVIIFVLIFYILGTGLYIFNTGAYLTDDDKVENILIPSKVNISVMENGSLAGDTQEYNIFENCADKIVKIKNIKDDKAVNSYIRVAVVPVWKNSDTNNSSGVITDNPIVKDNKIVYNSIIINLSDSWQDKWLYCEKDGFFYYKDIVPVDSSTAELITSVQYSETESKFLEVQILADGIQSEGNAYIEWKNITKNSQNQLELNF